MSPERGSEAGAGLRFEKGLQRTELSGNARAVLGHPKRVR
jgi:hypothetical protein